ncbi:unnamed protein product [Cyprideis torosa]|uniref:Uncharacterized protein n=1 Tax=Cyprideis torosa TaxID=163714 RepID=A0A7R8ZS75_9CRUS|nr:unnamed protein product [Cyprideis torosa]CAG0906230.1 unnamed protein product [Cyprideis torosa]
MVSTYLGSVGTLIPREFIALLPVLLTMQDAEFQVDVARDCKAAASKMCLLSGNLPILRLQLETLGDLLHRRIPMAASATMSEMGDSRLEEVEEEVEEEMFAEADVSMVSQEDDEVIGDAEAVEELSLTPSVHQGMKLYSSWKTRHNALLYLKVLMFRNLPLFVAAPELKEQVLSLVLVGLRDADSVEVRKTASLVLGWIFHAGFLFESDEQKLLEEFERDAEVDIKQSLPVKHGGILGLCAYVRAFPYDVPQRLPEVLMAVGKHVVDKEPIRTTVTKVLSDFKRTHYDNWRDHKSMFTEDQLAMLTDWLISPSYYA